MEFTSTNRSKSENELHAYFSANRGRYIDKWDHYFDIYEKYFSKFRNKSINILEIGVSHGGSLKMWQHYFGKEAKIYGIDINPKCQQFEEEGVKIFIGSQSDRKFLRRVVDEIGYFDIIIDDGGHTMRQQIITFEELYKYVRPDGIYLCEDTHTSYWLKWGGGHKRMGTFIEFSKSLIDQLYAYNSTQMSLQPDDFTSGTDAIHFYDGVVVFERKQRNPPNRVSTGSFVFQEGINRTFFQKAVRKLKFILLKLINGLLRFFRLPGFIWR